jgi:HK97 family phage portal protein
LPLFYFSGEHLNFLTKVNLLGWYAGQKVKGGIKKVFNLSLTDPKAWNQSLWNLIGSQSISGENVTESTALTYSAFWNAVLLISNTVSSLPLHLMQRENKTKKIIDQKSIYRVMHDRWNPYMTAMSGRWVLMSHILTWGNGYAEKVRNGYGEIIELWPITPNRITPKMEDGELVYQIKIEGESDKTLGRDKILHIPGPGFDGFVGYSIVSLARKSIGLGMAMETFGSHFFGQGTHPGVVVSHPNKLDAQTHKNMKNSLTEVYSGLGQSHRLMLLEEGMKIEKIGIPPEDSQFLESRQFQVPEIARWFNLPPHKLKDLTKSSFNNIESEQISFVTDSILPWLIWLEQNYNMQLLLSREQLQERLYFKHVVEGLLRGSSKDRAEFYKTMWGFGFMTENEVREKEDLDPNPNLLADELFIPANMVPLSKYEDYLAKNQGKSPSQPENLPEDTTGKVLKLLEHSK